MGTKHVSPGTWFDCGCEKAGNPQCNQIASRDGHGSVYEVEAD